jgi:hypothetical protein
MGLSRVVPMGSYIIYYILLEWSHTLYIFIEGTSGPE